MNVKSMIPRLFICTMLTAACDIFDVGDDKGDKGGDSSEGGNASEPSEGGSTGDTTGGSAEGGSTSGNDPSGVDSSGGGDSPVPGTTGESCEPDTMFCIDASTISVCVDGTSYALDCYDACVEAGYVGSFGCAFDEVSGTDVCLCDEGSGGGG